MKTKYEILEVHVPPVKYHLARTWRCETCHQEALLDHGSDSDSLLLSKVQKLVNNSVVTDKTYKIKYTVNSASIFLHKIL